MGIFRKSIDLFSKVSYVKYLALFSVFALLLPLSVKAENVVIWELDNFFSEVGGGSPDNAITEFTIKVGDSVTFQNQGATDHDVTNGVGEYDGETVFEGDVFVSASAQSPGDTFTTDPFPVAGELDFFCQIHGAGDMAGKLIIEGGSPTEPTPTEPKAFTFNCDKAFRAGPAGLESLSLSVGESVGCVLELTNGGSEGPVEISTLLRAGFRSSISVDPASGMTDEDGKISFTITGVSDGMDWIAWARPNDKGEMAFGKRSYNGGTAWGAFIEVE